MSHSDPPKPPPLPSKRPNQAPSQVKMSDKVSPLIQKLQKASQGNYFEPSVRPQTTDPFASPTGLYFFYGSLMDPYHISKILGLSEKPILRQAYLVGYSLRMWGVYPALVDGPTGAVVDGMVCDIQTVQHADRLAEYETSAYRPVACQIHFSEGKEHREKSGTTFKYIGNPIDLNEGKFDLAVWQQRMRKAQQKTQTSI